MKRPSTGRIRSPVEIGSHWAKRGAIVGLVVLLCVAFYASVFDSWYLAALLWMPQFALAGLALGVGIFSVLAFVAGCTIALYRSGRRRSAVLLVLLTLVLGSVPYGAYRQDKWSKEEHVWIVLHLDDDDPSAVLSHIKSTRSRWVVREHLPEYFVCAGTAKPEVVDALVALDPHGREGFALCGVSQYGNPSQVERLLASGFDPRHAKTPSGESCDPLMRLVSSSTASPPCTLSMMGEFDQFMAKPTEQGCPNRAAIAAMLIRAGAPRNGTISVFSGLHPERGTQARTLAEEAKESECLDLVRILEGAAGDEPRGSP